MRRNVHLRGEGVVSRNHAMDPHSIFKIDSIVTFAAGEDAHDVPRRSQARGQRLNDPTNAVDSDGRILLREEAQM